MKLCLACIEHSPQFETIPLCEYMYMYMELMDLAVVLFICSFAELPHQINLWSLYLESGESHCADNLVKNRFPANTAFNHDAAENLHRIDTVRICKIAAR